MPTGPSSHPPGPRWAGPAPRPGAAPGQGGGWHPRQLQRAQVARVWPSAQAPRSSGSGVGHRPTAREHRVHVQLRVSARLPPLAPTPWELTLLRSRVPAVAPGRGGRGSAGGSPGARPGEGWHPGGPSTQHALTAAPGPSTCSELGPSAGPGSRAGPRTLRQCTGRCRPAPGPSPRLRPQPGSKRALGASRQESRRAGGRPRPRASLVLPAARTPASLCGTRRRAPGPALTHCVSCTRVRAL